MRISLLEVHIEYFMRLEVSSVNLTVFTLTDTEGYETSLLAVGWFGNGFVLEVLFSYWFRRRFREWKEMQDEQ